MTEKQEFELVARAAGIDWIPGDTDKSRAAELKFGLWLRIKGEPDESTRRRWNPKTDDGDSRRLQVALRMAVTYTVDDSIARVWYGDVGTDPIEELLGDDPNAATRLAVWKAALEIARGMK